jgi:hypothetical protein
LLPHILWILVLVVVLDLYALWFVGSERTLYHADQVAYWSYSRQLSEVLIDDPVTAVRAVAHSVAYNDVNLLPAVPTAAFMAVFGNSRAVYLVAVISLYGLATAIMLALALMRVCGTVRPWSGPLAVLLLSTMWRPVFIGYLGIGGVALALAILAIVLPLSSNRGRPREMVVAGFLLGLLALFRRWWGIWAVGFACAMVVDAIWEYLGQQTRGRHSLRHSVFGPAALGFSAAATILILAAPITLRRLNTDYADRFAAYDLGSVGARMNAVIGQFGVIGIVLLVACAFWLIRARETRRVAVFLVLSLGFTYAMMVSIQDHSPQHWYLYYPQALLLVGMAIERLASFEPGGRRQIALGTLVGVAVSVTTAVYLPPAARLADNLGSLLPTDRLRPQVRSDLLEVDRLLTFLDQKLEGSARIYVLASSRLLSDQVLGFSNLSLGTQHLAPQAVLGAAHVDRRDGFPNALLTADIVLVADPLQVHLREQDQMVIAVPVASFVEGRDVSLAFRRVPEVFHLDGGVRVLVFERIREHEPGEVEAFSARLRAAYPDRPEIYGP